jgi:hypothetical protein
LISVFAIVGVEISPMFFNLSAEKWARKDVALILI